MTCHTEFLKESISRMKESLSKISECLKLLDEEDIWKRPNDQSNSVGNQILHLSGNITQYIISSLGNSPDHRHRDAEFEAKDGFTKQELEVKITETIRRAIQVISAQNDQDILVVKSVQGFDLSGIGIIIHVVEHLSYHTGQIIFWTKQLKAQPMNFYDGIDLNAKNTN